MNGLVIITKKKISELCSPVCDLFIFVSLKMRATTSPSRSSRHHWYLRIDTNFPASSNSGLPTAQREMPPSRSSNACTRAKSLSCFSRACRRFVSIVRVESWAPGVVFVNILVAAISVTLVSSATKQVKWNSNLLASPEVNKLLVILHLEGLLLWFCF